MADLARQSVFDRLVGADLVRSAGRSPRIPANLDNQLRDLSKFTGRTVNDLVVEALAEAVSSRRALLAWPEVQTFLDELMERYPDLGTKGRRPRRTSK